MCGIVGYVGDQQAVEVLLQGLSRLEYRGYDSAGLAIIGPSGDLDVLRRKGKLVELKDAVDDAPMPGTTGIGHTRWATHGRPSEENAHPQRDCSGEIAVVHNGIIENFIELREDLQAKGHVFTSETDTETVAHLVESLYDGDLVSAVSKAVEYLDGSYALGVVHRAHPGLIVGARKDSPLVIGVGEGENLLASDIPAVLKHTREVVVMQDGEIARITAEGVDLYDVSGKAVERPLMHVSWDLDAAEKGGYEDFMLKEIHEQPRGIRETLRGRMTDDGRVQLSELDMGLKDVKAIERVYIIACGTSYHAGLVAKRLIESWAKVQVEVITSSEFRYSDPLLDARTLVVAITQSGETADTLAGVRKAAEKGAKVLAITNVVGSSVTREAKGIIYTHAGPEIGVAATKTFTAQIAALYVLALYLAQERGTMQAQEISAVWEELQKVPAMVERVLQGAREIEECSHSYTENHSSLFLGRGLGVPIAMEGALKLKEISYIHAEAYPAGEMKHGPIALITPDVPVIVVAPCSETYDKVVSNIQEVKARGANVIAVASEGDEEIAKHAEHVLRIPRCDEWVMPIPAAVPLQLLAYHIAKAKGCNVDQPRNLAKSVTVE